MSLDLTALQDVYIQKFYENLDTPRSLMCYMLYRNREYKQLVSLEFDPLFYNDVGNARDALAATKFLSKATFLQTGNDLKEEAKKTFFAAEAGCAETNFNIKRNLFKQAGSLSVLLYAARKISDILGSFVAEEFVDSCNWGPGATTLLPRRVASHPEKFSSERRITSVAYDFVKPWFRAAYPNWDMMFEINGSAKIITVPKNAKTDRTISIEPGMNLWFQKGIGKMIRTRLKRVGIDLNTQSHNQEKARLGSKFETLATIDFSSASDTVSYEIVRELLPPEWFNVLNVFRSSYGLFDGELVVYNKFSSMGNGFTFELESLIFYAIASACCMLHGLNEKEVSVFGDDVIVPSIVVDTFRDISKDLGFTVNEKKSYSSSYYRESCGSHFWNGRDIKPIFLKESFDGQTSILKAANNLRRFAHSRNNSGCDHSLRCSWQILADALGPKCPRISDGYGDIALVENFDESGASRTRCEHGVEGYLVRVWAVQAVNKYVSNPGLHLTKLKAAGTSKTIRPFEKVEKSLEAMSIGNEIPMPGHTVYSRMRVHVPHWADLGPWC